MGGVLAGKKVLVGNRAKKQEIAVAAGDGVEKENENSTKEKVMEDMQVDGDTAAKSNSNDNSNAASGEDGGNDDDGDDDDANENDKTEEDDINDKPTLKQKVMSFFGKNGNSIKHDLHPVAHLNCNDHGGPSDPHIIDEMVFWVSYHIILAVECYHSHLRVGQTHSQ